MPGTCRATTRCWHDILLPPRWFKQVAHILHFCPPTYPRLCSAPTLQCSLQLTNSTIPLPSKKASATTQLRTPHLPPALTLAHLLSASVSLQHKTTLMPYLLPPHLCQHCRHAYRNMGVGTPGGKGLQSTACCTHLLFYLTPPVGDIMVPLDSTISKGPGQIHTRAAWELPCWDFTPAARRRRTRSAPTITMEEEDQHIIRRVSLTGTIPFQDRCAVFVHFLNSSINMVEHTSLPHRVDAGDDASTCRTSSFKRHNLYFGHSTTAVPKDISMPQPDSSLLPWFIYLASHYPMDVYMCCPGQGKTCLPQHNIPHAIHSLSTQPAHLTCSHIGGGQCKRLRRRTWLTEAQH